MPTLAEQDNPNAQNGRLVPDQFAHYVGQGVAEKLAPQWIRIGHGLAALQAAGDIISTKDRANLQDVEDGLDSMIDTTVRLGSAQETRLLQTKSGYKINTVRGKDTPVLDDGIQELTGPEASDFIDAFGHSLHTANTRLRGFVQLVGRRHKEPEVVQATELISAASKAIEEEAGNLRIPRSLPPPPNHGEPPAKGYLVEKVVAEKQYGSTRIDVVLEEVLIEPEPSPTPDEATQLSTPSTTVYELPHDTL